MPNRRNFLAATAGLGAACLLPLRHALAETAEAYPSHAIRVLMPYTAGGAPDLLARAVKAKLEAAWKQPVIVEDRPGGNGIVACELVAHSSPDGYTMVMGSLATHAINASAYKKLPYNPIKDFTPITQMGTTPLIITGHPSVPAKSLAELVAYARENPGKLSYASVGPGSLGHLSAMLFQMQAGVKMVHVPYRGISQGSTELLGGTVDLAFSNVLNVLPFVKTGQLRAYGVTSAEPISVLPDVPPVASVLPGYDAVLWWGMFAAAGTPAPIVEKLNHEIRAALADPAMRAQWAEQAVTLTGNTPDEFAALLKSDIEKWGKVVAAAGVSL